MEGDCRSRGHSSGAALALAGALLALTILVASAWAASGGLDHSFSGDGRKLTAFGNGAGDDNGKAVAIQANGRIVVVGGSDQGGTTGYDVALARYFRNGGLDHSFSGDGRKLTAFGNGGDFGEAVAIQPNGKIVVAGSADQGGTSYRHFAVARYNPNGGLDHSFSGDGRKLTAFGSGVGDDYAVAVAIQPNGKIVVAGQSDQGATTGYEFALARYNPNGGLDHTFSGNGRKLTAFGNGTGGDFGEAMAIQPNGKIVVAGESDQGGATGFDVAVARYSPNGGLDHSFSGDGRKTTAFSNSTGSDSGNAVAMQPNGKIVVAGFSDQGGASSVDFALARYDRNGTLDHSFSGDGRKTTAFGNGTNVDNAHGLAIQPNGKIVAVGSSDQFASGIDLALARYNLNGGLDHSFSGDGRKTTAFSNSTGSDSGNAVAIQANGRIVVVGASDQGASGNDFALARYLP